MTSAQKRAAEYLAAFGAAGNTVAGGRLPSIRTLAAAAHVSHFVMHREVRTLIKNGLFTAVPRHGIYRAGHSSASPPPSPSAPIYKWEKIKNRLAEDLLAGVFKKYHVLPPGKDLERRYGVNSRTIRKATDALEKAGLLSGSTGAGTVLRRPNPSRTPQSARIVLVVEDSIFKINRLSLAERTYEFQRYLETACRNARMGLTIIPVSAVPGFVREKPADLHGAIIWTDATDDAKKAVTAFLRVCPVAVIDETASLSSIYSLAENKDICFFSFVANSISARDVGNFLLTRGHKTIAYISALHGEVYSKERLNGLTDAYAGCGLNASVMGFTSPLNAHKVFDSRQFPDSSSRSTPAYKKFQAELDNNKAWFPHESVPVNLLYNIEHVVTFIFEYEQFHAVCTPLFTEALKNPAITAWVCANDSTALMALEFLRMNPASKNRVFVIGFDDRYEAFQNDLSSYNFNTDGLVHRVLNFLLNHHLRRKNPGKMPVETPGFVVERATRGSRMV